MTVHGDLFAHNQDVLPFFAGDHLGDMPQGIVNG